MCMTLAELKRAAADWSARFEPAVVPLGELNQMIQDACDIGKMMATAATLGAEHRAATGPGPTATRRAVREFAHAAGTSLAEASRSVKAAQQLRDQPEVASAARAGELSRQQVTLVADAVAANPGAAPRLLALARTGSLQELADESARAIAAKQDLEARHGPRFMLQGPCGDTPTRWARGTCTPKGHQRRGLKSWPRSAPLPTKPSSLRGGRAAARSPGGLRL